MRGSFADNICSLSTYAEGPGYVIICSGSGRSRKRPRSSSSSAHWFLPSLPEGRRCRVRPERRIRHELHTHCLGQQGRRRRADNTKECVTSVCDAVMPRCLSGETIELRAARIEAPDAGCPGWFRDTEHGQISGSGQAAWKEASTNLGDGTRRFTCGGGVLPILASLPPCKMAVERIRRSAAALCFPPILCK